MLADIFVTLDLLFLFGCVVGLDVSLVRAFTSPSPRHRLTFAFLAVANGVCLVILAIFLCADISHLG